MDQIRNPRLGGAGAGGKRLKSAPDAEGADKRKAALAQLRRETVEGLLRAGPTATRKALREDSTLVSFLDSADFARLAAYAKSHPPPAAKIKPGADVFKVMNAVPWRQQAGLAGRAALRFLVSTAVATAIVWLTYRGVLRLGFQ